MAIKRKRLKQKSPKQITTHVHGKVTAIEEALLFNPDSARKSDATQVVRKRLGTCVRKRLNTLGKDMPNQGDTVKFKARAGSQWVTKSGVVKEISILQGLSRKIYTYYIKSDRKIWSIIWDRKKGLMFEGSE